MISRDFNTPTNVISLIDVFKTLGIDKRIGWKLFINPKFWTYDVHRGHPDLAYIPYIGGGLPGQGIRFWKNRSTDMNYWTTNESNKREMIKRFKQLHPAVVGKIMKINIDLREHFEEINKRNDTKNRIHLQKYEEQEIEFTGVVGNIKTMVLNGHTNRPQNRVSITLNNLSCREVDHCHILLPVHVYIRLSSKLQFGKKVECIGTITKYHTENKYGISRIRVIDRPE